MIEQYEGALWREERAHISRQGRLGVTAETDNGTVSIHLGTVGGTVQGDSLLPRHSLLLYLEIEQTLLSAHEIRCAFTTSSQLSLIHSTHSCVFI